MKGLNEHLLDFEIVPTNNSKTLVFLDSSSYHIAPTTPILQLKAPSRTQDIIVQVTPSQMNYFNSNDLGITNQLIDEALVDLEDGVWQATYRICPYNELYVSKCFVRFELLNKKLAKIYSKFDVECCDEKNEKIKKQLIDIYILIESANANATLNYKDRAQKDYKLVCKKVTSLLNLI